MVDVIDPIRKHGRDGPPSVDRNSGTAFPVLPTKTLRPDRKGTLAILEITDDG